MLGTKPTESLWGIPAWGQSTWGWSDEEKNQHLVGVLFFTAGGADSQVWSDGRIEGILHIEGEV